MRSKRLTDLATYEVTSSGSGKDTNKVMTEIGPSLVTSKVSSRLRKCLVTGDCRPADQLVRFVISPNGQIIADLAGRLPGRGVWVQASAITLHKAFDRGLLAKAFRSFNQALAVTMPWPSGQAMLQEIIERQEQRCMEALGLARRCGVLVVGFDKVQKALRSNLGFLGKGLLMIAEDAGRDSAKLEALAFHKNVTMDQSFTLARLSAATGLDHVGYLYLPWGEQIGTGPQKGQTGVARRAKKEVIKYQNLIEAKNTDKKPEE